MGHAKKPISKDFNFTNFAADPYRGPPLAVRIWKPWLWNLVSIPAEGFLIIWSDERRVCVHERIENPSMLTDWWLACKFTANYWGKPTSFSDITQEHPLKTKKYIFCFDKSLIYWLENCKPIMTFTKCFLTSLMSVFVYFTVVCWQVLGDL